MIHRKALFSFALAFLLIFSLIPAFSRTAYAADSIITAGKSYTVTSPLSNIHYGKNDTPASSNQLTDSTYASSLNYGDSAFTKYLRGVSRTVTINLGSRYTVHNMELYTLQDVASGIIAPKYAKFYISADGTNWSLAGTIYPSVASTVTGGTRVTYALSGLKTYGNYVRVTFPVEIYVYADEFRCWGVAGTETGASAPVTTIEPSNYVNAYPAAGSSQASGVNNEVLLYTGYHSTPGVADLTTDELKPYVAHLVNGAPNDWMFDGVLFMPFSTASSSRNFGPSDTSPSNMADWTEFLDAVFSSTYQLGALDSVVGQMKTSLNDSTYKEKVRIAIPYPDPHQSNFGDVNGDGISENFDWRSVGETSAANNRNAAVDWYINNAISRWNANNYQNLQLTGFYWYNEEINSSKSLNEDSVIQHAASTIHNNGKTFEWIPFYQAAGFDRWQSLGFDIANMQPNYSFFDSPSRAELTEAATYNYKYGMAPELEIHWEGLVNDKYLKYYYDYLDEGLATNSNYQNNVYHTYYQNSDTFLGAYNSTFDSATSKMDPNKVKVYDNTYSWMKGTYSSTENFFTSNDNFDKGSGDAGNYLLSTGSGTITSDVASEVINGGYSAKGSVSTTGNWVEFLKSDPSKIKLPPNASFQIDFDYKITSALDPNGGYAYFIVRTPTGGNGADAAWQTFTGAVGSTQHKTITGTAGNYSDYQIIFGLYSSGSITVDNVKTVIYYNDTFEDGTSGNYTLNPQGTITSTAGQVVSGAYSLKGTGTSSWVEYTSANTAKQTLNANSQYILKFDYKIVTNLSDYSYALVRSATGGNSNDALWKTFNGAAGASGTASYAFSTGNYSDYKAIFGIYNSGSLSIDNVKLLVR